jgi:hypothetical protein
LFSFGASQANVIIDAWAKCQIKLLRLRDGDIVKVSFPPDMPAVSRQKMLDRLAEMVQRGCVGGHICVIDASSVDVVKSNEAGLYEPIERANRQRRLSVWHKGH